MKRGLKILLGLAGLALLIALLIWAYGEARGKKGDGDAGDAPVQTPSRIRNIDGLSALELDRATQNQGGIKTGELALQQHLPTITGYATVLDIQPLIDLRTRHDSTQGQYQVAQASASASQQEFKRLLTLYRNGQNTSLKAVQAAEASWKADQARMDAAHAASRDIRHQARQQWGKTLSDWALASAPSPLTGLLDRQRVLLRVTVPVDETFARPPAHIQITGFGGSAHQVADLISASPQSDPRIQGQTYFYQMTTESLASGMRLKAWLPKSGARAQGVIIPPNAVVWYAGQPWVYIQRDSEHFIRRAISAHESVAGGWFVSQGFKPGERVVINGAQLLLSEEFKPQSGGGDAEGD